MSESKTPQNQWQAYPLAEVLDLIGGGTPKTTVAEYWNGDIPWLSVTDFNTNRKFVSDSEKKITEEGLRNSSTKILEKGDIIISARGTVGVVATIGSPMAFNQSCYGIKAKADLTINDFVYYLLKNTVANFLQKSHGGVFDTITQNTFKEIEIDLPPLSEQKAIAEVLSSLDDKIDLLHRQNETLEDMAQTLFRKRFVENADDTWEEKPLDEIVIFLKGKKPKEVSELRKSSFLPQILIETFNNGKTLFADSSDMVIANKDDVLMVMDGASSGRVNVGIEGVIGSTIGLFRPKEDFRYPLYLYHFLKFYEKHIKDNTTGSAIPHADKRIILNLRVSFKSFNKLQDFENFANDTHKKIFSSQSQIRTLEKLRDTLLPKLMSGKVRVKFN